MELPKSVDTPIVEAVSVLPVNVEKEPIEVMKLGTVAEEITWRVCVLVCVPCMVENRIVDARTVETVAVDKTVALLIRNVSLRRLFVITLEKNVDCA